MDPGNGIPSGSYPKMSKSLLLFLGFHVGSIEVFKEESEHPIKAFLESLREIFQHFSHWECLWLVHPSARCHLDPGIPRNQLLGKNSSSRGWLCTQQLFSMGKVGFIPLTPHPAGIFLVLPLPSPSKIPLWLFLGFPLGSAHLKVKFPSAPANPMGSLSLEFPIPGMFKARLEQPGILEWDKIPFLPQPFQDSGILGLLPKFKHSPGIFPNSKRESTSHPWAPAALGCSHPHSQEEFCHGRAAFPNSQMPNSSWEGKLGEAGALPDFFPPIPSFL